MPIEIPTIVDILHRPEILLSYIQLGGWVCTQPNEEPILYDGTCRGYLLGSVKLLGNNCDQELINVLITWNFIHVDSGNFDFNERFYCYNDDWYHKNNFNKNKKEVIKTIVTQLKTIIKNKDLKTKYKQEIRIAKLNNIIS